MISRRFALAAPAVVLAATAAVLLTASDTPVKPAKDPETQKQLDKLKADFDELAKDNKKQFEEMRAAFDKLAGDNKKLADELATLTADHQALAKLHRDLETALKTAAKTAKADTEAAEKRLAGRITPLEGRIQLEAYTVDFGGGFKRGEHERTFDVPADTIALSAWVQEADFLGQAIIRTSSVNLEKRAGQQHRSRLRFYVDHNGPLNCTAYVLRAHK